MSTSCVCGEKRQRRDRSERMISRASTLSAVIGQTGKTAFRRQKQSDQGKRCPANAPFSLATSVSGTGELLSREDSYPVTGSPVHKATGRGFALVIRVDACKGIAHLTGRPVLALHKRDARQKAVGLKRGHPLWRQFGDAPVIGVKDVYPFKPVPDAAHGRELRKPQPGSGARNTGRGLCKGVQVHPALVYPAAKDEFADGSDGRKPYRISGPDFPAGCAPGLRREKPPQVFRTTAGCLTGSDAFGNFRSNGSDLRFDVLPGTVGDNNGTQDVLPVGHQAFKNVRRPVSDHIPDLFRHRARALLRQQAVGFAVDREPRFRKEHIGVLRPRYAVHTPYLHDDVRSETYREVADKAPQPLDHVVRKLSVAGADKLTDKVFELGIERHRQAGAGAESGSSPAPPSVRGMAAEEAG